MSVAKYAIILNGDQISEGMKRYGAHRIERQYHHALESTKQKFVDTFKKRYSSLLSKNASDEDFFKFLNTIQQDKLSKSAEKMADKLKMGYQVQDISKLQAKQTAETYVRGLQGLITSLTSALKTLNTDSFSTDMISYLQKDNIIENIKKNGSSIAIEQAKNKSREFFLEKNSAFTVNSNFLRSVQRQETNIRACMSNLAVLMNMAQNLEDNPSLVITEDIDDFTKNFLYSSFNYIGKIIGIVSEGYLLDVLEEYVDEKIIAQTKDNTNIHLKAIGTGTQQGSVFQVKTTDISFQMDVEKMLKNGQQATFSVNLPGASIKRTRTSVESGRISLKTNTLFKNWLDNMRLDHLDLLYFFSAYVNYRRSFNKHFVYYNKEEMNNLYSFFKVAMFPMAAAGSLTKDDFAYFLVVNDKTYNIFQIMESFGSGEALAEGTDINLHQHQQSIAQKYSQYLNQNELSNKNLADAKIINDIYNLKINYKLYRAFESSL